MFKRVQVIINPASGKDAPVLAILNTAFKDLGIEWDASITKEAGDATRYAQEAVAKGADVVAVYGGDGTVNEVATGLIGSDVPMAILPGGTANALALALEIPGDTAEAIRLLAEGSRVMPIDVGEVNDRHFLIAVGIGLPGEVAEQADRDAKDRLGVFAYVVAGVQALRTTKPSRYRATVDGEEIDTEGVTAIIANSGNFGMPGVSLAQKIEIDDGKLDLLVVNQANIESLMSLVSSVVRKDETVQAFEHWQAREIRLDPDPPQAIQVDGEVMEPGVVVARVLPSAVKIVVPLPKEK